MNSFYHEQLYRLRDFPVTVCGAGALGANIVDSLARTGLSRLRVVDRDRIEARNLSTQPFYRADVGAFKATMLGNVLYRALGVEVDARSEDLTAGNARKFLRESALVVDAFDNSVSRRVVKEYCENEVYRVPSAAQDDVCDYPLARNLVTLAVAVVCETIVDFITTGARRSHTITLRDFAVRTYKVE
jgi:tRNA A37 threonylcarbamoyladenosine dehydratase